MENNKWKNKKFIDALKNAFCGIKYVLKTQRNLQIQLRFAIFAIICGIILKINATEWVTITLIILMVIVAELINTVTETVVDMYTTEYNERAKIAKDVAAGAVTIAAIGSIIIGIIIFLPKIINMLKIV